MKKKIIIIIVIMVILLLTIFTIKYKDNTEENVAGEDTKLSKIYDENGEE